ncbi:MAG: prepilin-type N-terminal cleavage/methylation domain-containing protein [Candidatus Falkowbacteria bacterium]|nr:prepilin-type N-terminal cleavage/methylation domain-containing protein [Candidatus Falkowbacteria bacterium]
MNILNRNNNYNQGFTLIELLLYVSLMSIMMMTVSFFATTLVEVRIKNQTISDVEQQGLRVMQVISQTIRNADSVTSPTAGSSASSLSLVVASPNSPTVFNLSSGILQITEAANPAVNLTNSRVTVSGLTFTNLSAVSSPGTVRIQFTVTYNNPSGQNQYNYSKTFYTSATLRFP